MSRAEVLKLADGRVFSGDRSLKYKLIDAVGGEDAAKAWLVEEKGLDEKLKLLDWEPVRKAKSYLPFSASVMRWITGQSATPLDGVDVKNLPAIIPKRLFLDGLLSIWHN